MYVHNLFIISTVSFKNPRRNTITIYFIIYLFIRKLLRKTRQSKCIQDIRYHNIETLNINISSSYVCAIATRWK